MSNRSVAYLSASGCSDMGKTNERLLPNCKGAKLLDGIVFKGNVNRQKLTEWVDGLNI